MTLVEIENALKACFAVNHLEVINESFMHSVPKDSLTHIKVVIVSEQFQAQRLLERHRAVYHCLAVYMQQGLHAVSVHAYTLEEWQHQEGHAPKSPPCHGGRKNESKS